MARRPGIRQVRQAERAINAALGEVGMSVRVIDHRDCGEGLKIVLDCGESYIVSEMAMRGLIRLPKGTFLECVNSEVLGLYYI